MKITYEELDYNVKNGFNKILYDEVMKKYGTLLITEEQFGTVYNESIEASLKGYVKDFYASFRDYEPELSKEVIKKHYSENVCPITEK